MANRIISRIVGLLLLAAVAAKVNGLRVDALPQVGLLSMRWVQVATLEWEAILALWLFWGHYRITAWAVALATFAAFAAVSAHLGFVGESSCGCFGALSVSPWIAFGLDVAVIAALTIWRPDLRAAVCARGRAVTRLAGAALCFVLIVGSLLGAMAGAATLRFGSTEAALAHLRNERIAIRPRMLDVGVASCGEVVRVRVEVVNWTDREVRIVGGTADCSCFVLEDLPVTIPPGERRHIAASIASPKSPGVFMRDAYVWTDDAVQRWVLLRFTGESRLVPNE